jgi:hypothetical protein
MKSFLLLFLFHFPLLIWSQDVSEIRKLYTESIKDEAKCKALYDRLFAQKNIDDPRVLGYQGAISMVMAKYDGNPLSKLSYFKKGKDLLENALKKAPQNLELHFVRFGIQENLPSILMYNENLYDDKNFVIKHLEEVNQPKFKQSIIAFLLKSENVSEAEKVELRKLEGK